ncbi:MAG: hypothetical protein E7652_07810 [Ruminococcaceae bacterium]|nr:hypothetical protein [Oscillospiraceae bacterium]
MGFLDNALKKVGATLATKYGVVSSGKYSGFSITMGNPPKEKVSTAYSFSQMIILDSDKKEEIARLTVAQDIEDIEYIETIKFPSTGNDGYRCKMTFPNGETCNIDLFPSKLRVLYGNLNEKMRKETREFFEKEIEKLPQT